MSQPHLFEAIAAGDAAAVSTLTAADPSLVRSCNADGVRAIVWAAYVGKPEIAEQLAAQAAELDMAEAAVLGRSDEVARLLDAGAGIDDKTRDGFTALHYAAFFGHPALARLLVDRGADVDACATNDMQVTPLHSAAAGGHREVALLLVGAGANVTAVQRHGWTPLHAAAQLGDDVLARALVERGADAKARAEDGTTPIELAAAGHPDLAAVLSAPR